MPKSQIRTPRSAAQAAQPQPRVCLRCGHHWLSRDQVEPTVCPLCKSPYWSRPRRVKRRA